MPEDILSVREIQEQDIIPITEYWLGSDPTFLHGMGVEVNKMPGKEEWNKILSEQLRQPYNKKQSYCIIWQVGNKAIGHSNTNKIIFGEEAYMHLHIWNAGKRKKGIGSSLVRMTLPYFFENLKLKKLYCEPSALNPAPNKTLEKVGFTFIKEYTTTPGWLNFEQEVNRWELRYEQYKNMK
ncbi:MAG: GNAT family N-acetyltransferase [Bacteroidia bacterium]